MNSKDDARLSNEQPIALAYRRGEPRRQKRWLRDLDLFLGLIVYFAFVACLLVTLSILMAI